MISSKDSENLENSLWKKEGQKSLLDARDLWALKQQCTKERQDSVLEIAKLI